MIFEGILRLANTGNVSIHNEASIECKLKLIETVWFKLDDLTGPVISHLVLP